MSNIQRATIVFLVIAALAVWGLGLRAALRPVASADQEPTATPGVTDTPAEAMTRTPSSLAAILPPTLGAVLKIPTPTATATFSPTATTSRTATPSPSASATATRQPSPSPSPTAVDAAVAASTATRRATASIPTPYAYVAGTPIIPQTGRFLLVDQDKQLMRVYEDGNEIRAIPISSGRPVANAFTPAWRGDVGRYWGGGPFLNTDMWSDYMWYLFPGARGSILIHSVPYTWENDLKIYDRPDALGVEPASHGCVRISTEDAQWLKGWDPVGVPINITPWSGEIGPPDESL